MMVAAFCLVVAVGQKSLITLAAMLFTAPIVDGQ